MHFSGLQVLDSIPHAVAITDLSGCITTANSALVNLLHRDSQIMVGCPLADITGNEYHVVDQTAAEKAKAGDTPDPYIKELLARDGTPMPVEVHTGVIREGGNITHIVYVMKPLSQEMQLLQQLQRRNMQLVATSQVSKAMTQILNIQEVLTQCVDMIRTHFGFYYAAIFLIDDSGKNAVLRAATGDAGKTLLERGHALGVGSKSMVGWVTQNNAARIALDVGEEAIRFDNPLLPKTRSEMALPLRVRGNVIGALDVQTTVVNGFSPEDIQTIQMMADQVAIAIDNARLFSQAQVS